MRIGFSRGVPNCEGVNEMGNEVVYNLQKQLNALPSGAHA